MHAPHVGLARVLKKNGKPLEAVAEYGVAAKKSRQGHFTWYSKLMLPYVYENTTDIDAWRERLLANLKQLSRERLTIQDPFTLEGTPQYFLSYHGRNDTQVYRQISQVLSAACPQIKFVASHVKSWEPPADGQRIKVGFCSYFFRDHSVSKMIMGLLEALDRRKFHVVLINLGVEDTVTKRMLKPHVSEYLHLKGKDFQETARSIEKAKLDVLVMAEIGMHDNTYALAHARLAPIQVAMHGHAQTSGVTAVDYFVSYAGFSEPDAQSHYSEMLVELPGLTPLTRWYDPELAGHSISKQMETEAGVSAWKRRFGIPLGKTVYACLQTLFKIDPTMDRVVKRILAADPQAVVVFKERQDANMRGVTLQLLERMRRSLSEEEMGRVVFLPTLAQQDYNDAYRFPPVRTRALGRAEAHWQALRASPPLLPVSQVRRRCSRQLPVWWAHHFLRCLRCRRAGGHDPDSLHVGALHPGVTPLHWHSRAHCKHA